jgi:hypothetical protein
MVDELFGNLMFMRAGVPTHAVTMPVMQVRMEDYLTIRDTMSNYSFNFVNVTVTDEGFNEWLEFKESGILIGWSVTMAAFCGVNIAIAIWSLASSKCVRSISMLCLILEIYGNAGSSFLFGRVLETFIDQTSVFSQ